MGIICLLSSTAWRCMAYLTECHWTYFLDPFRLFRALCRRAPFPRSPRDPLQLKSPWGEPFHRRLGLALGAMHRGHAPWRLRSVRLVLRTSATQWDAESGRAPLALKSNLSWAPEGRKAEGAL